MNKITKDIISPFLINFARKSSYAYTYVSVVNK